MGKPVTLAVDDDPEVLNFSERDLRLHYSSTCRILKASSGDQAMNAVREFKQRGDNVALFLVDERMPGMTGTEFLGKAIKLYPEARRVLLTAYADTDTAIKAIHLIGLDHYLLKPWEPPGERIMPRIYDPPFTTKPPGQGTGLGLDTTRRLLPRYDGDITVESGSDGTRFRVSNTTEDTQAGSTK